MIHEKICTYEVAKLAKEKGFPQWFNYTRFKFKWDYYNHKGVLHGDVGDILKLRLKHEPIPEEMKPIAAPTQSLLQRWLREEKGVDIAILPLYTGGYAYAVYNIHCKDNRVVDTNPGYATYELALEAAIAYSLKNLV